MTRTPNTVTLLLDALRTLNPTAPRLTWYGPSSERVELSGRVLENWVAKTANFLTDELDAESGTMVALDVPVHWRSFVWLLASWAVGATVVAGNGLAGADQAGATEAGAALTGPNSSALPSLFAGPVPVDIVATSDPGAAAEALSRMAGSGIGRAPLLVAVALPALAMRWPGVLPGGAVDYSGEVRAHADVYFPNDPPSAEATAWMTPAGNTTFGKLLAPATPANQSGADQAGTGQAMKGESAGATETGKTAAQRVLLEARNGWDAVVRTALLTWAAGGSIVLLDPSVAPTEHLRGTENVTHG